MSFVRRKRGQVLLVHNERIAGSSRVRQRQLHRFSSPSELDAVLKPTGWKAWTRSVEWRERDIEFDWSTIRGRLEEELAMWGAAPSGAKHRRNQKLARLTSELALELESLSRAQISDAAVVEQVRPALVALRESIDRLLAPERVNSKTLEETNVRAQISFMTSRAEDIFDEGMEYWWEGDQRSAAKAFRRVLQLDPQHADAHNHLGIVDLEARRLKAAERHFRAAVEGGLREVERDGDQVPWGIIENRPYLRGLANLALVSGEQKRWEEALGIHKRLLELDPNDSQGARWLIGVECLRVGDSEGAISAFERCLHEEVGCAFGLALAKLLAHGPSAEVGEALLTGFAANRYVAPMLLGEPWVRLDAYHGSNMAEPEWADDIIVAQADLWQRVPRGAELLRFWWAAPVVANWRRKLDEVMVRLKDMPPSDDRTALVCEWSALSAETTVRDLVKTMRAVS